MDVQISLKFLHSSHDFYGCGFESWMQEWNGGELWCGDVICFIKSHWCYGHLL